MATTTLIIEIAHVGDLYMTESIKHLQQFGINHQEALAEAVALCFDNKAVYTYDFLTANIDFSYIDDILSLKDEEEIFNGKSVFDCMPYNLVEEICEKYIYVTWMYFHALFFSVRDLAPAMIGVVESVGFERFIDSSAIIVIDYNPTNGTVVWGQQTNAAGTLFATYDPVATIKRNLLLNK